MLHVPSQAGVLVGSTPRWTFGSDRTQACGVPFELESLCKDGQLEMALLVLVRMDQQGSVPPVEMYRNLLQACMKMKALAEAKWVHAHLAERGLGKHRLLSDLVVATLVHCGSLADGLQLFRGLPHRTAFSWTAIISGYSNAGKAREALLCYKQMQQEGVQPDKYTFVSILKACSRLEDLEAGKRVHADVMRHGCDSDVFVGSTLVSMYAKCGSTLDAQQVFAGLSRRDVASWNAMIAAYAQEEEGERALQVYCQMQEDGAVPDDRTFVSALQACGTLAEQEESVFMHGLRIRLKSLRQGKELHAQAARKGIDSDVFVGSTLVSMYAKCGSIRDAQSVFDGLLHRNVVLWNAMIAAHVQQGQGEAALQIYAAMQSAGFRPDARTFVSTVQACGYVAEKEESTHVGIQAVKLNSLRQGKQMHAEAVERGFELDTFVGSALVCMYAKCCSMKDVQEVFDRLCCKNVGLWNVILAIYAQHGQGGKAIEIYDQMQEKGIMLDARTFVSCIQACSSIAEQEESAHVRGQSVKVNSLQKGKEIHQQVAALGYASDMYVGSTLVSMYAKCGSIKDAEDVFHGVSNRDVVLWNAMIAAYAQHDEGDNALKLYAQMQLEGIEPGEATFLSVLEACSSTGALDTTRKTHRTISEGGVNCNLSLATSLIHAYGKCGSMEDAQEVFDSLPQPSLESWNALIAGYARQGDFDMSERCYEQMCSAGWKPDGVTFLPLLLACSHACMVFKGLEYFESMTRDHGISASIEHYVCVIDLVGRAGLFHKVDELLSHMTTEPTMAVWLCLLGACRKHGNVALARRAFDCAVRLQPEQAAPYVLMSNIYAHAGLWDSADDVDQMRRRAGAWKQPGQSWIKHEQEVHTFLVGDHRHQQEAMLHRLVDELS